jgi:tetratricopeptide (TPR) repeat protein
MAREMSTAAPAGGVQEAIQQIQARIKSGELDQAARLAKDVCADHPMSVNAYLLASQVEQRLGHFDTMLSRAEQASAIDSGNLGARFRMLECLLYCGRVDRVLDELAALERKAASDHHLLCKVAEHYTHCADHESALRCYRRASKLDPGNADYLFALASSEIANGDLDEGERLLDRVIALNPHDYDAYRNRATLKKQSADNNHIDEILSVLNSGVKRPAGETQLCYALAKEYEDLNEDLQSFHWLQRGANKRRSLLSYRVEGDLEVMARLQSVFNQALMDRDIEGSQKECPIFVIGLPRSGTTLADRILSSHLKVASLGEINNFAYSLMHTIGKAGNKVQLVDLSANIDFAELGERYLKSMRSYRNPAPYLIDKTPLNYLYVGLIHLALPKARIIHIQRNPMDSCYGMYRTLFRAGYPFSYDFDDLARYYIAYVQLMQHWRTVAPDALLDVSYEDLVNEQEKISREIIGYCGLDWEPACLDFHKNTSAVATASSAQVRRPVYRDALQRWRRYEDELQPLIERLREAGIALD